MRIGSIISLPNEYSQFARIKDEEGLGYTVDPGEIPKEVRLGDQFAYKVDLFGNDSGLAYGLKDE
jgi:hypothetical protein